jgi:flagellar hook-associated protein 1 FlgK
MSLIGALNIGRNALAAQQAALQVTTNNISNAGNPDYTRQSSSLVTTGDTLDSSGHFLGNGVTLAGVNRQIDNALEQRLRSAISDSNAANTTQSWISRTESVFNALGSNSVSGQLSQFFNTWSRLASNPQDLGLRQIVLTNGQTVANTFNDVRNQLSGLREDLDNRIQAQAGAADDLASQVADLNSRITVAEGGSAAAGAGQANALRDQRDALLKKLSNLVDISTTEDKGNVNVYIGSQPVVLGSVNRGIAAKQGIDASGNVTNSLVIKADGKTTYDVKAGELGGLIAARSSTTDTTSKLDTLAKSLIFELNKVHSSGQGLAGFSKVIGTNSVQDANAPLDSAAAGLANPPTNGSFVVTVKSATTGLSTSKLIKIDLTSNSPTKTTLNSLAAQINDPNISASVAGGQLTIKSNSPDTTITFSQDSSGVLASLGVNTFFTGHNASDIGINYQISSNPQLLAAARNGSTGDNQSALSIASLDTASLGTLGGLTLRQSYDTLVSSVAATTAAAKTTAEGAQTVQQTLEAQRESLSGVSLDEESINLIKQQRAFQGAARIISTVDEMLQTVLNLVR